MPRFLAAVVATLLAFLGGTSAAADPLDDARAERDAVRSEVASLRGRLATLGRRYDALDERAGRLAAALVDDYRESLRLDADLDHARNTLSDRARAAYQMGPAGFLEAFLSAGSVTDMLVVREAIQRTFVDDVERVAGVLEERGARAMVERRLEQRRRELFSLQRRLEGLRQEMGFALLRAREEARRAGARVAALKREARRLAAAERRARARAPLITGGLDQSELLALLGPDGGRGCDIPSGLRPTGSGFEGIASWYGWDFAGRPTASGAIFDPRLFTAAHRTLPLPSFLHVRHGGRCATVLVNDRGPFIEGRVLDLSLGAAEYLGVGLSHVEAEILVPRG
ncbi:MAG TPA: RlpA-like double-psi beta-barrel domain-containing protein [Actinomycetota bacterium]